MVDSLFLDEIRQKAGGFDRFALARRDPGEEVSAKETMMKPEMRRYRYVGPAEIKERAKREAHCIRVTGMAAVVSWSEMFLPSGRKRGTIPATFIIDTNEWLWIADRHSEHVGCADGGDVLAAGEIVFSRAADQIWIEEISNQSTGYCPEPESWVILSQVLGRLGMKYPSSFTAAFIFRRCDHCKTINIIKDDVYECAVCDAPLSQVWNCADGV